MDASTPSAVPSSTQRPRSVTILAWLLMLQSLTVLGYGLLLVLPLSNSQAAPDQILPFLPFAILKSINLPAVVIFLGLVGIVTAIAILSLQPWSWMVAVMLQGFSLVSALAGYLRGHPTYIAMAACILLVIYLNYQEIQTAISGKREV